MIFEKDAKREGKRRQAWGEVCLETGENLLFKLDASNCGSRRLRGDNPAAFWRRRDLRVTDQDLDHLQDGESAA